MKTSRSYFNLLDLRYFTLLFIVFCGAPFALGQDDINDVDVSKDIIEIDIQGNKRIETSIIKNNVSARVGEPLSPETVRGRHKKYIQVRIFRRCVCRD